MSISKPEIIIIGAGASGLSAALRLTDQYHVTILEARNRIGGRIHSLDKSEFSSVVELGAEFIHGNLPTTFELIQKYNLITTTTGGIPIRLVNGRLVPSDFYFDHWDEFVKQLQKLKQDLPVAEFLDIYFKDEKYESLRNSIRGFAEGYDAADTNLASTFALRDEWLNERDEKQFRLADGYGNLILCMADDVESKGGDIILNSAVNQIKWSKNNVEVSCQSGEKYTADKIIITVPVGVMQSKSIEFLPAIPDIESAFQKLGYGHVIKFLFEFENKFWETDNDPGVKKMGFLFAQAEIPTWWTQYPSPQPLLTGWLAGPNALALKNKSDDELYKIALQSLSDIFGMDINEISNKLIAGQIINWPADEFAMGAYSYATVNAHEARKIIMHGVEETIWFAGEGIYNGREMGTVEAALASGKLVADVLLQFR